MRATSWSRLSLALGITLFAASFAVAASYPSKPIEMIIGFRPGGTADTVGRVVGKVIQEELGQPVVYLQRAGGGGGVAAATLAGRPGDGYSIGLFVVSTVSFNPQTDKDPKFSDKDFKYIGSLVQAQEAIVATAEQPFGSIPELVAYAKGKGMLNYASVVPYDKLMLKVIGRQGGVEFNPVPTKGGPAVIQSLLGGQTVFGVSGGFHQSYVKAGKLKVLAATTSTRLPTSPDAPTLKELGYDLESDNYFLVAAPKDTPDEIVAQLAAAVRKAVETDAFRKLSEDIEMPVAYHGPEELTKIVENSTVAYRKMIDDAK